MKLLIHCGWSTKNFHNGNFEFDMAKKLYTKERPSSLNTFAFAFHHQVLSFMPPKLIKTKPNNAEKRKALQVNISSKRPKTDDSASKPENTSSTSTRGTLKKNIINLEGKLVPLPDEAYYNLTAVELFREVEVYSHCFSLTSLIF